MSRTFSVGDHYGGGIVFHVNPDGKSGLVASEENQGNSATWEEAKKIANKYNKDGYDDWYLPSKEELDLLWQAREIVGVANDFYWSSTDFSTNYACYQQFNRYGFHFQGDYNKLGRLCVRAIRAF